MIRTIINTELLYHNCKTLQLPKVIFNFSLKCPYIIQQTGSENTQTQQVVVILISQQILVTNLQINVSQLEGRINNLILGCVAARGENQQSDLWS